MNLEIGDKVIIRQWDRMEEQFGLDNEGDIECPLAFTKTMKKLCGLTARVKSVKSLTADKLHLKLSDWPNGVSTSADLTSDMVLPFYSKGDEIIITDGSRKPFKATVTSVSYATERVWHKDKDENLFVYSIKNTEHVHHMMASPLSIKVNTDALKDLLEGLHATGSRIIAPETVKETTDHDYFKIGNFTPTEKRALLNMGFKRKEGSMSKRLPGNCFSNLKYDIWDTDVAYGQAYLKAQIELTVRNDKKARCAFLDSRTYMFGEPEGFAYKMGGFMYCKDSVTGELHKWPEIGSNGKYKQLIESGTLGYKRSEGKYETPYNNTIKEEHVFEVTPYN
jgi:hypothetical protein